LILHTIYTIHSKGGEKSSDKDSTKRVYTFDLLLWLSCPKELGSTKKSLADSQSMQIGMLAQMMKLELGSAQASAPVRFNATQKNCSGRKQKAPTELLVTD